MVVWPLLLWRAVVPGLAETMREVGLMLPPCVSLTAPTELFKFCFTVETEATLGVPDRAGVEVSTLPLGIAGLVVLRPVWVEAARVAVTEVVCVEVGPAVLGSVLATVLGLVVAANDD